MMYKVEYQYEDEENLHSRFYSALDANTAKAMFEETCEESLSGCNVKLVSVCPIEGVFKTYTSESLEDSVSKH